jgi:hypothetical protein
MTNISNAVFADYKTLSFLFYSTRNMDIFLLIFQPSEFLNTYTIVITRLLPYFRPRFSVLSRKIGKYAPQNNKRFVLSGLRPAQAYG